MRVYIKLALPCITNVLMLSVNFYCMFLSELLISFNFATELRVLLPLLPSGGPVPAAAARSPRGRQGQGLTNTLKTYFWLRQGLNKC